MSRIRSIHPGIWTSERFVLLGAEARIFLLGIWTEADDQGIFEWSPLKLKMRLAPADNWDASALLDEIAKAGIIRKFDDGKPYGAIRNFQKWQRPKQPMKKYPFPEDLKGFVGQPLPEDEKPARGTALGKMLCEKQCDECYYCGEEITFYRKRATSLEVDHKTPVSRGGADSIENLVAACKPCNSLKGASTAEEFILRFSRDAMAANSREKRSSHPANELSHNANHVVAIAETGPTIQRKEEGGRRKDTEANASDAFASQTPTAIDVQRAIFDTGVAILTATGSHDRDARSMLGKWRKDYGDSAVLTALSKCQVERPEVPIEWITGALKFEKGKANGQQRQSGNRGGSTRDAAQLALARMGNR